MGWLIEKHSLAIIEQIPSNAKTAQTRLRRFGFVYKKNINEGLERFVKTTFEWGNWPVLAPIVA